MSMLVAACTTEVVETDAGKKVQAIGTCVNLYLESEAGDYFENVAGDGSSGAVSCGDDPLYYLDQTWNCIEDRHGVRFAVTRYSPTPESWQYIERAVIASNGDDWKFRCEYDDTNVCGRISCWEL
jgi:hypothetical protein